MGNERLQILFDVRDNCVGRLYLFMANVNSGSHAVCTRTFHDTLEDGTTSWFLVV